MNEQLSQWQKEWLLNKENKKRIRAGIESNTLPAPGSRKPRLYPDLLSDENPDFEYGTSRIERDQFGLDSDSIVPDVVGGNGQMPQGRTLEYQFGQSDTFPRERSPFDPRMLTEDEKNRIVGNVEGREGVDPRQQPAGGVETGPMQPLEDGTAVGDSNQGDSFWDVLGVAARYADRGPWDGTPRGNPYSEEEREISDEVRALYEAQGFEIPPGMTQGQLKNALPIISNVMRRRAIEASSAAEEDTRVARLKESRDFDEERHQRRLKEKELLVEKDKKASRERDFEVRADDHARDWTHEAYNETRDPKTEIGRFGTMLTALGQIRGDVTSGDPRSFRHAVNIFARSIGGEKGTMTEDDYNKYFHMYGSLSQLEQLFSWFAGELVDTDTITGANRATMLDMMERAERYATEYVQDELGRMIESEYNRNSDYYESAYGTKDKKEIVDRMYRDSGHERKILYRDIHGNEFWMTEEEIGGRAQGEDLLKDSPNIRDIGTESEAQQDKQGQKTDWHRAAREAF